MILKTVKTHKEKSVLELRKLKIETHQVLYTNTSEK